MVFCKDCESKVVLRYVNQAEVVERPLEVRIIEVSVVLNVWSSELLCVAAVVVFGSGHVEDDSTIIIEQSQLGDEVLQDTWLLAGSQIVDLMGLVLEHLRVVVLEHRFITNVGLSPRVKEFDESEGSESLPSAGLRCEINRVSDCVVGNGHGFWIKSQSEAACSVVSNGVLNVWVDGGTSQDDNLIKNVELRTFEMLRHIIFEISSLNPEVESLLSISEFPESVFISCKTGLARAIINHHIAFCVAAIINIDQKRGLRFLEVFRCASCLIGRVVQLNWNYLSLLKMDLRLSIDAWESVILASCGGVDEVSPVVEVSPQTLREIRLERGHAIRLGGKNGRDFDCITQHKGTFSILIFHSFSIERIIIHERVHELASSVVDCKHLGVDVSSVGTSLLHRIQEVFCICKFVFACQEVEKLALDIDHGQKDSQLRPSQADFHLCCCVLALALAQKLTDISDPVVDPIHAHTHGHGNGIPHTRPRNIQGLLERASVETRSNPRCGRVHIWPFTLSVSGDGLVVNQLLMDVSVQIVDEQMWHSLCVIWSCSFETSVDDVVVNGIAIHITAIVKSRNEWKVIVVNLALLVTEFVSFIGSHAFWVFRTEQWLQKSPGFLLSFVYER